MIVCEPDLTLSMLALDWLLSSGSEVARVSGHAEKLARTCLLIRFVMKRSASSSWLVLVLVIAAVDDPFPVGGANFTRSGLAGDAFPVLTLPTADLVELLHVDRPPDFGVGQPL